MIDPAVGTAQETAETDMARENDLRIGGDVEVENTTTGIGEMTPTIGTDDPARTLLTRGPVAEAKTVVGSPQVDQRV